MRPLKSWSKEVPLGMPLTPVSEASRDEEVRKTLAEHPEAAGTVVEALMWLRLGRFDLGHELVQDATRGVDAYVHGMLHRLEGDFWNANYWFRQTRDPAWEAGIRASVRERTDWQPWDGDFDPALFTRALERWHGDRGNCKGWSEEDVQTLARAEWEAVWENALNSLFFNRHDT